MPALKVTATPKLEMLGEKDARILIDVECSGVSYQLVHVSGPAAPVKEYFEGLIDLDQLRQEFNRRPGRISR